MLSVVSGKLEGIDAGASCVGAEAADAQGCSCHSIDYSLEVL